jgi:hypothetical protein
MKAFEFETLLNADGTLLLPADLRKQIPPHHTVRVLLLLNESEEDADWARLTTTQFLQGYDAEDVVYDNLPGR